MSTSSDKRMRRTVRRSYIISTISIALVLFILGAVSYVTLSAITAAESLRERVVVSVEIADGLDKTAKRAILRQIRRSGKVASFDYMSKDEKLDDAEFRRQFELDIHEILDHNPLRDSFELTLKKEAVAEESVREFVGHGIGRDMHEDPQVPNYGTRGRGTMLKKGMCVAIEPMITLGSRKLKWHNDGWGVSTIDGKCAAHFEHTVAVGMGKADILSSFEFVEEVLRNK